MGATPAILAGINTVGQFAGQQRQAKAVTQQADFQSSLAATQATDIAARGAFDASQRSLEGRRAVGAQRAAAAASGVDANSGTEADLQSDETRFSAFDATMIRNNATRAAWGLTTQAALNQYAAQNEAQAIRSDSYRTLLTGFTNTYGLFSAWRAQQSKSNDPGSDPSGGGTSGKGGAPDYGFTARQKVAALPKPTVRAPTPSSDTDSKLGASNNIKGIKINQPKEPGK